MEKRIVIICSRCKKVLGTKDPEGGKGGISHGLCPECAEALRKENLAEIEDMKKATFVPLEGGIIS